ncbi:MAG: protein-glutamate O-methyltransferase CheR [Henriciella sp.]|nr:protein-glutamate O-methyltransferase CheR [Henriciella sp.]
MQDTTFETLADLALKQSGQAFHPNKRYLMEARLATISRRESFATLDDLAHCLKSRPNPRFEAEVAAALTGKLTRFFGDRDLFDRIVTHVLPERLKLSKTGRLRIWCAGVSTGQEVYSLIMRLGEEVGSAITKADLEIIGTDISADCIETATVGSYGHFDVQKGLSVHRLMLGLDRNDTGDWQVKEALRQQATFKVHNLLEPADALGLFDVIICRNVLSAMAEPMQKQAADNLARQLLPGGLIFTAPGEKLSLGDGLVASRTYRGALERVSDKNKVAAA